MAGGADGTSGAGSGAELRAGSGATGAGSGATEADGPEAGAGGARVEGQCRGSPTRCCTGSSSGAAPTLASRSSFHVGYGDRDIDLHRCNPLLLTGLLRALEPTGVPVMLLHNYPYHREAGYLAQVFPLVYADLGLATHNVGARATALLGEALELVPLRKFLFSSDAFGLPELYYLGALLFRRALSEFLATRLSADDMSYPDAERVTRLIGAENATPGLPAGRLARKVRGRRGGRALQRHAANTLNPHGTEGHQRRGPQPIAANTLNPVGLEINSAKGQVQDYEGLIV